MSKYTALISITGTWLRLAILLFTTMTEMDLEMMFMSMIHGCQFKTDCHKLQVNAKYCEAREYYNDGTWRAGGSKQE